MPRLQLLGHQARESIEPSRTLRPPSGHEPEAERDVDHQPRLGTERVARRGTNVPDSPATHSMLPTVTTVGPAPIVLDLDPRESRSLVCAGRVTGTRRMSTWGCSPSGRSRGRLNSHLRHCACTTSWACCHQPRWIPSPGTGSTTLPNSNVPS